MEEHEEGDEVFDEIEFGDDGEGFVGIVQRFLLAFREIKISKRHVIFRIKYIINKVGCYCGLWK